MLDDYGFEIYEQNEFPLAYLITIRTFGTWLHGDERYSVDRHGKNIFGTNRIAPNKNLEEVMKSESKQSAVIFNKQQRKVVESAVRELCEKRNYFLHALNVRTNHAHAVVSAQMKPERIADAFKAFATKKLREENLVSKELKVWSRGRSRPYLWKPRHVEQAIFIMQKHARSKCAFKKHISPLLRAGFCIFDRRNCDCRRQRKIVKFFSKLLRNSKKARGKDKL